MKEGAEDEDNATRASDDRPVLLSSAVDADADAAAQGSPAPPTEGGRARRNKTKVEESLDPVKSACV